MVATSPGAASDAPPPDRPPDQPRRRRRPLTTAVVAAAVAVVVVVALLLVTADGPAEPAMPRFSLTNLAGGAPVTYPAAPGTPTVVAFFASWCVPCQTELPMVARVAGAEARAGSPVRFVGVDGNDDPTAGLAFARRSGVTFAVGRDDQETVASALALPGLPDIVFVDRSGRVVHRIEGSGQVTVASLRTLTEQLAAG